MAARSLHFFKLQAQLFGNEDRIAESMLSAKPDNALSRLVIVVLLPLPKRTDQFLEPVWELAPEPPEAGEKQPNGDEGILYFG